MLSKHYEPTETLTKAWKKLTGPKKLKISCHNVTLGNCVQIEQARKRTNDAMSERNDKLHEQNAHKRHHRNSQFHAPTHTCPHRTQKLWMFLTKKLNLARILSFQTSTTIRPSKLNEDYLLASGPPFPLPHPPSFRFVFFLPWLLWKGRIRSYLVIFLLLSI